MVFTFLAKVGRIKMEINPLRCAVVWIVWVEHEAIIVAKGGGEGIEIW